MLQPLTLLMKKTFWPKISLTVSSIDASFYLQPEVVSQFKTYWLCDVTPVYHSTTARSAHTVFMCCAFISEQTATCATYCVNWLVFKTEMKSVYSAVRTGALNTAVCASALEGSNFIPRSSQQSRCFVSVNLPLLVNENTNLIEQS